MKDVNAGPVTHDALLTPAEWEAHVDARAREDDLSLALDRIEASLDMLAACAVALATGQPVSAAALRRAAAHLRT